MFFIPLSFATGIALAQIAIFLWMDRRMKIRMRRKYEFERELMHLDALLKGNE